ncbi:hypothetical protein [Streptomyces sp. NPDC088246]|uniref:hypothetical protein n=1 Tax=Streptomyces sp. NPDC088246 TaxID=3365842 RepID=UPI00382AAAF9
MLGACLLRVPLYVMRSGLVACTLDLLLTVLVTAASVHDSTAGAHPVDHLTAHHPTHVMAEGLELADQVAGVAGRVDEVLVVVGAEGIFDGARVVGQMPDSDED